MEEKIKLIITKLEELVKKQKADEENRELQEANNKGEIEELEGQNKRLVSMRSVFSQEEEEYGNLSKEIEENETKIKELSSINYKSSSDGLDIRSGKVYKKETEEIEKLKEEVKEELTKRQKFLIINRKSTQEDIEKKEYLAKKHQNRLPDRWLIKRDIEKGFIGEKEGQEKLAKVEAQYKEYDEELARLKELEGLSEEEIYAKIDQITKMIKEIDDLTLDNIKAKGKINFEEVEKDEEGQEEQVEENRQVQELIQKYEIEKGSILYEIAKSYGIQVTENEGKKNVRRLNFPSFVRRYLSELEKMNKQGNTEVEVESVIAKLKEDMQKAGIKYQEKSETAKEAEQDRRQQQAKNEEKTKRKAMEEENRKNIERKKRRAEVLLYTQYEIVEGDIIYELVMEALETNITIGSVLEFANQHLEALQKASEKASGAEKEEYNKVVEKLKIEIAQVESKIKEEERAKEAEETKKQATEEQVKRDEEKRREQQEILKNRKEEKEAKKQEEIKRQEVEEQVRKNEEKRKVEEQARKNNAVQKYYQNNIQAKGVDIVKVPYIRNSIRKEIELGKDISNLEEFLRQRLVGLEQLNQQRNGRYTKIIKDLKKEMKLLGIESNLIQEENCEKVDNRVKKQLVSLKIGKCVTFVTKDEETGDYSKAKYGFKNKEDSTKVDIFDEKFMYASIIDGELLKKFNISEGLQDRLDPVVVNALMRIDAEYNTNHQYVKEYIECMMTRGKKPMNFNIQYDLKELNGGKLKQILSKLIPSRNKVTKRQKATIIESIQKHAMRAKYFGKKFNVTGKYNLFSKNKPKRRMEVLPAIREEQQPTATTPVQQNFRKALRNPINDRIQQVASPTIKNAEFKNVQSQTDLELDDDFEILEID